MPVIHTDKLPQLRLFGNFDERRETCKLDALKWVRIPVQLVGEQMLHMPKPKCPGGSGMHHNRSICTPGCGPRLDEQLAGQSVPAISPQGVC
jgi:hypothetical protein